MNTIDDKTAGLWEAVTALRHELHRNPELSGQEIETKKRLMAFIRTQSHLKIVDLGDWFYALYVPAEQNGEAPVAFRADMDALPPPDSWSPFTANGHTRAPRKTDTIRPLRSPSWRFLQISFRRIEGDASVPSFMCRKAI
ncbi:hypothetical protein [Pseudoramibacter sp.]|nr:hypothetical protein [Pseudoramibacter sp.]MCH4073053.1 hypothetical protein [Pseudoramibacter sp.]